MIRAFNWFFSLRYFALLAIIAPFMGAILMLLLGAQDTVNAYRLFFGKIEPEGALDSGESAMIQLVASLDHFLFATILMLFSFAIFYLLFQTDLHGKKNHDQNIPRKKQLTELGGVDDMLLKVIIMLLAVNFLEFILNTGIGTLTWTVLVIPITIISLALGLKWMTSTDEKPATESAEQVHLDELERWATLHSQGAITDDEYEAKKKKVLHE